MKQKCKIGYMLFGIAIFLLHSCTKLDERFRGDLTENQVGADSANASALLDGVYTSLREEFTAYWSIWPLLELSTDEAIAPTRGQDWDDNGIWRVLHQQKWPSTNERIKNCFNVLNGISYAATDILRYHPTKQQQAEARFIRALVMYFLLDLFDQVPYRDPGESLVEAARVRTGMDAWNYIVSEINAVKPDLQDIPPKNNVARANKFAARVLLMKCYLNKAVYINRANPSFASADMDTVINLADDIIRSGAFSFSGNYFDNFVPDNDVKGQENIFTLDNAPGTPGNNFFSVWLVTMHYNQFWPYFAANGFTTLSDFYDKFEPSDLRRGMHYIYSAPGFPSYPNTGINVGFFIGQQYNPYTGEPLTIGKDAYGQPNGTGIPLSYTREVSNLELNANLEVTGIRPFKYFLDWSSYWSPNNDLVFFRFPDVLLMKAEAVYRGGATTNVGPYGGTALDIVNSIRTDKSRSASRLPSINDSILLDERGRELWWEGWRRQDMIRFKKFLDPFQGKEYQSESKYLLYPIPDEQLAVNPNLKQNLGY